FRAKAVPERKGINPLTGKKTAFAPGVRVSFKPGKPLKETVENGRFIKGKTRKKALKRKM
ncbi:MAG: DNA-binding protein, partial [Deltaproteobacteria bacterium]